MKEMKETDWVWPHLVISFVSCLHLGSLLVASCCGFIIGLCQRNRDCNLDAGIVGPFTLAQLRCQTCYCKNKRQSCKGTALFLSTSSKRHGHTVGRDVLFLGRLSPSETLAYKNSSFGEFQIYYIFIIRVTLNTELDTLWLSPGNRSILTNDTLAERGGPCAST